MTTDLDPRAVEVATSIDYDNGGPLGNERRIERVARAFIGYASPFRAKEIHAAQRERDAARVERDALALEVARLRAALALAEKSCPPRRSGLRRLCHPGGPPVDVAMGWGHIPRGLGSAPVRRATVLARSLPRSRVWLWPNGLEALLRSY